MRILIADKDPHDLEAMRSDLAGPGIEIITARDGREVLVLARAEPFDVVVVASSLGQMGGFAVARQLKMDAAAPGAAARPKVAVLLERAADRWLASWSTCDEFRTKPLAPGELEELVTALAGEPAEPTGA